MSGRKRDQKKKDFVNNPFKNLKGLSVSGSCVSSELEKEKPTRVSEPEDVSFARAMEDLGVDPMGPVSPCEEIRDVAPPAPLKTEEELFLEAFKGMDTIFEDSIPQDDTTPPPPRRMKLLRQGKICPDARLDLHGLNRSEARQKVRFLLEDSVYQGKQVVLIITGKGNGSEDGPVLRDEIEKYLRLEVSAWVVEWGRAPQNFGGEGALVVFLRQKKSPQS